MLSHNEPRGVTGEQTGGRGAVEQHAVWASWCPRSFLAVTWTPLTDPLRRLLNLLAETSGVVGADWGVKISVAGRAGVCQDPKVCI